MLASLGLQENEELSWGGGCPRVDIKEVELELGRPDSKEWWETRLENKEVTEGRMLAFSDGKGWLGFSPWGAAQVGNTATVWDGQIAGMLGVVEKFEIRGEDSPAS